MSDLRDDAEERKGVSRQSRSADQSVDEIVQVEQGGGGAEAGGATTDAWTMAALAHASVLLTLILAFAGGVGAFVGLVVPLVIYLSYRQRSRFTAFHAMQALAYQGAGVLTYLVLVVVLVLLVTAAWTISGLLAAVAIGFLLMPLALLLTVLMVVVLLGAPLAWVAYGLYAAYQVYQGKHFHYWLLGEWVEREVRV
jgi:uncharacterized Tic20 family protein